MKLATAILITVMAFAGCKHPLDLRGSRPVTCEEARGEVLEIAAAQETFDHSATRSDDPVEALAEVWAVVKANGYWVIRKPNNWGPLSRYTQTFPFRVILLKGSWEKGSAVTKIATVEHELMHMWLELSMPREEFIRQYLGNALFRVAVELAAYKVSLKVARRYGKSAAWEELSRRRRVRLLFTDYLISLAVTEECLTLLAGEIWGPVKLDQITMTAQPAL